MFKNEHCRLISSKTYQWVLYWQIHSLWSINWSNFNGIVNSQIIIGWVDKEYKHLIESKCI